MRPAWSQLACLLLHSSLVAASTPPPAQAAPAAANYERWLPPQALDGLERDYVRIVRRAAARRGIGLAYDARLAQAATGLLPWARSHAGETLPLADLRQAAWQAGWTDGTLSAIAVRAPQKVLPQAVARQLEQLFASNTDIDQMGIAVDVADAVGDHFGDRSTVVLAVSRRLVRLAPIVHAPKLLHQVVLTGTTTDPRVRGASMAVHCPDGHVALLPVALRNGHFSEQLGTGHTLGALDIQLLVDRGQGPEVAAHFPLHVGGQTTRPNPTPMWQPARASSSLLALVYGLRAAHGLPLPAPAPTLMRVARAHAEDMVAHQFFAHVSQRTGDVTQRLRALQQDFDRVVENIAQAQDIDDVFAQWLQSPSHLANLLDPSVSSIGIGIVEPTPAQPSAMAVLVMATLKG